MKFKDFLRIGKSEIVPNIPDIKIITPEVTNYIESETAELPQILKTSFTKLLTETADPKKRAEFSMYGPEGKNELWYKLITNPKTDQSRIQKVSQETIDAFTRSEAFVAEAGNKGYKDKNWQYFGNTQALGPDSSKIYLHPNINKIDELVELLIQSDLVFKYPLYSEDEEVWEEDELQRRDLGVVYVSDENSAKVLQGLSQKLSSTDLLVPGIPLFSAGVKNQNGEEVAGMSFSTIENVKISDSLIGTFFDGYNWNGEFDTSFPLKDKLLSRLSELGLDTTFPTLRQNFIHKNPEVLDQLIPGDYD